MKLNKKIKLVFFLPILVSYVLIMKMLSDDLIHMIFFTGFTAFFLLTIRILYSNLMYMNRTFISMQSIKESDIMKMFDDARSHLNSTSSRFDEDEDYEEKEDKESEKPNIPDTGIRFADIAGCEEEKVEVQEIIEFLKNPEKFTKMGATIPKGVLFVGPPGTGKTLLAKAIANEAGVNFINIAGSEFVEKYVGTGASRVRTLFKKAIKQSPTLIFIDEIDAVGGQRGGGGNTNDEREQTLNQLLVEMDGFANKSNVVVIAATNRPELLDKALLRPGRFDRRITINLPDTKARREILEVHARNKKLNADINLEDIAKKTFGFSGAELASTLNEAALLAVRDNKDIITNDEIYEAIDRVMMGPSKKSNKYTEKDKRIVSYHEAGHAVAGLFQEGSNKVERITIIPRGDAGGYTSFSPSTDKFILSKSDLAAKIISLLGGRAAEEIVFGEVTTGASNDLKRATEIARSMVTQYGMSSLGLVQYESTNSSYSGYKSSSRNYSEDAAIRIDKEVDKIVLESYEKVKEILNKNRNILDELVKLLLEQDTLNSDEIERVSNQFKVN